MSEADRIDPDQAEPALEPLGIKEPLRSPSTLGQSKFLMPLGLRSLSVLQPIAVHPQVENFDFSSIQAAEPTHFQEPESTPNLQRSGLSEPNDQPIQLKPSTHPKPHPGTSLSHPMQGVVQFFKSVLRRKDAPIPEKTSTPELLSVTNLPQPISEAPSLIQPQRNNAATPSLPQTTSSLELAPEPASPSFIETLDSTIRQRPDFNLDVQKQTENLREGTVTQAVTQQFLTSNLEVQQCAKDTEINASKETDLPFVNSQTSLQENSVFLSVDSQDAVPVDGLDAIALTQFDLENRQDLNPQKITSENFLIPASNTIQSQQEDQSSQEIFPSFSQKTTQLENLVDYPEITTVETDLDNPLTREEVSASKRLSEKSKLLSNPPPKSPILGDFRATPSSKSPKMGGWGASVRTFDTSQTSSNNEPAESSQIQRQSAQSIDSVLPISSVEILTEMKPAIQAASNNQQAIQPKDNAQTNQNRSVIETRNEESKSQDLPTIQRKNVVLSNQHQPSTINAVEINTLQAKQENSLEEISYSLSLETDAGKQSIIQSPFPISPEAGEPEDVTSIQQFAEASAENGTERAIGFIPERFTPERFTSEIGQQETPQPQPSLQIRKEPPPTEISESLLELVVPAESITLASLPQLQQRSDWTDPTSANPELLSLAEPLLVSEPKRDEEPASLHKKSDGDAPLSPNSLHHDTSVSSHNAAALNQDASSIHLNSASICQDVTSTHYDSSAPNPDTFLIDEDTSLRDRSPSSIVNHGVSSHGVSSHGVSSHGVSSHGVSSHGVSSHGVSSHGVTLDAQENWVGFAAPDVLQLREEAEVLDLSSEESSQMLLGDFIPSPESSLQDGASVEVAELSSLSIQRRVENACTDTVEVAVTGESVSLGEIYGENADATIQRQSNEIGDRENDFPLSTRSGFQDLIEPNVANATSVREPVVQRYSAIENAQTVTQSPNSIRLEPDLETLPNLQGDGFEGEIVTVSSEFTELETPLQDISNESSLPNAPTLEKLGVPEIRRELEESVNESPIETREFSDIESENPLKNETLLASVSDSGAFVESSIIQRELEESVNESPIETREFSDIESENFLKNETLLASVSDSGAFVEPSISDSFQINLEQSEPSASEQSAVASSLQNVFATESFSSQPQLLTASEQPNPEPQNFPEDILDANSAFASSIPDVQTASVSASEIQADFASVEERVADSVNFVPDSIAQFSTEPAIALSPSESFVDHDSQLNYSKSSERTHSLTDAISNSSNIQGRVESLEPVVQNSTPFNNVALPTEIHLNSTFQSIHEVVENTSDISNQPVAKAPTIQAASTSSSGAFTNTYAVQENAAVEVNKSAYSQPDLNAIASEKHETSQNVSLKDELGERNAASPSTDQPSLFLTTGKSELDITIQQRPIENIDFPSAIVEAEILSQALFSNPATENSPPSKNLSSSASELQPERLETDSLTFLESSTQIQQPERPETDNPAISQSQSSPDIPLDSASYSQNETPVVPLSPHTIDSLFSSSIHPGSNIQRSTDSETIAEHENAISQSSPDISLELESRYFGESLRAETSSETLLGSSSEAIAQPSSESAIAIPFTEPSSQAIGNTWDISSSYDSTPNGRRDAQIAASQNHLPVDSESSHVLPNPLSSDIQRFIDGSSEHSSLPAQLDNSEQSEAVNLSSSQLSTDLPQLPRFLQDLTVLKPLVQRLHLNTIAGSVQSGALDDLPLESSYETIAQPFSEPTIAIPIPRAEPFIPIANDRNTTSSYDSTPNGRRDAQIAAAQDHLPVESESPLVLSNPLSSDIQRFIDGSSEHSSLPAQLDNSEQSEAVSSSSSQLSANLPQLPRFLQDLTVLKPLVQRSLRDTHKGSPLHNLSDELPVESSDSTIPLPFQNSFSNSSPPHHKNPNLAIQTQPSSNTQPTPPSALTNAAATVSAHPGTSPSAWSSIAELINPKPTQPQQSHSTNYYSPLAPNLIQAKFATPTLQKEPAPNAPIEVLNAPTTTLSSNDFQQEAQIDTLLETLAQEIYGLLRQKMEIERERQGRNLGRMPW